MTPRPARHRVGSLLRLMAHEPGRHLFLCDDQSVAFGFTCRPLSGGDDSTEQRLRTLLALEWPTGTLLGFHLIASPAVRQQIREMIQLRSGHGDALLEKAIAERAEHLWPPSTGRIPRPTPWSATSSW